MLAPIDFDDEEKMEHYNFDWPGRTKRVLQPRRSASWRDKLRTSFNSSLDENDDIFNPNWAKPSFPEPRETIQTEWEKTWKSQIQSIYVTIEEPPQRSITPSGNILPYPGYQSPFGATNLPETQRAVYGDPSDLSIPNQGEPSPPQERESSFGAATFPEHQNATHDNSWNFQQEGIPPTQRRKKSPFGSTRVPENQRTAYGNPNPRQENQLSRKGRKSPPIPFARRELTTIRLQDFRGAPNTPSKSPPKASLIRIINRSPGQGSSHAVYPPPRPTSAKRKVATRFDDPVDSPERLNKRIKRFSGDDSNGRKTAWWELSRPAPHNLSLEEIIEKKNITPPPRRWEHSPTPIADRKYLVAKRELKTYAPRKNMRPVVIDGCNVAYACGAESRKRSGTWKRFDCYGIRLCVDHFRKMGCTDITVVVPEARLHDRSLINGHILQDLKKEQKLMLSCSKQLGDGRWVSSYDDRFILQLAEKKDAVIVSNDRFHDIRHETRKWNEMITQRRVGFNFYEAKGASHFYAPNDPFGRYGKTLQELLTLPNRSPLG